MIELKGNDMAPYYGLSSTWVDENGKLQTDYHIWVQNRPNHEIEYFGKPKGWMPEWRKKSKWAVRYDNGQAVKEHNEEPDELLVESSEEIDPALAEDDENIMPEPVLTDQDIRNQMAYHHGYAKHMLEAHERYNNKHWWQFWIKEDDFPRYPIENEEITRDNYGRVYITEEVYKKIQRWDEEIERKKKSRLWV